MNRDINFIAGKILASENAEMTNARSERLAPLERFELFEPSIIKDRN